MFCDRCRERLPDSARFCGRCGRPLGSAPGEPERLIGRQYRVIRHIGAGGMGEVLECEDVQLERRVAVKLVQPCLAAVPGVCEGFLREARALAAVRHPCVLPIYHLGTDDDGTPYLVTELIQGESLEVRLARGPALGVAAGMRILRDAAQGLGALHRAGLIHRDVKPANLLLRAADGRALVADAGMAWRIDADGIEQVRGGTVGYAPPEQLEGKDGPDTLADVYALAATAYHTLVGRIPFPGANQLLRLEAQRRPPRPPSSVRSALSPFDALFRQALSPDRRARLETVGELTAALEAAARHVLERVHERGYVLVADDDLDIRAVLHACLRGIASNLEVRFAVDGEVAIRMALHDPPALLLLDLDMPIKNGLEVLGELRGHPTTRDLPVIVVSGAAGAAEEALCRSMSVCDVVTKPIDALGFSHAVQRALGGYPTVRHAGPP